MCLILFCFNAHPRYHLVLAANRDEFHVRPTTPLSRWDEAPHVLAGRDLKSMGTWLGITTSGRFAAITNYRDPKQQRSNAPSRGVLVSNFLLGDQSPTEYLSEVVRQGSHFNGFNLIVGDANRLFYYGNRGNGIQNITPGIHGLSNHLLDTPWPKISRGIQQLDTILQGQACLAVEPLFDLLSDNSPVPDEALPDTGVGLEFERFLAPLFIAGDTYGTRCSSVLLMERNGTITFAERTFEANGKRSDRMFKAVADNSKVYGIDWIALPLHADD